VNGIGQRTNVTQNGSVRDIAWGYDTSDQVISAQSNIPGLDRANQFNMIGNRLSGGGLNPPSQTTYTTNALNQYSSITNPPSPILNPSHDSDGNQINSQVLPLGSSSLASCVFSWDYENRLIQAQVNSGGTVNFIYDSQSRRIAETVGTTTKVTVYDE
jgi:YD repeat-containing protein